MKKEYLISVSFVLAIAAYSVFAATANQIQTVDGGQRNRITSSSSSSSGAQTNATTVWTSPFLTTGLSNVFGAFGTGATNIVNGFLGINTGAVVNVNYPLIVTPNTGSGSVISKMRMESTSTAGYDAGNASRGWQLVCDGIADVYDQTYGTIGTRYRYRNGTQYESFDGTTLIWPVNTQIGSSGSAAHTVVGTMSMATNIANFAVSTNTPTVALKVVNTIYTNTQQRMTLICSVIGTVGANSSGAAIWASSGGVTNWFSLFQDESGLTAGVTTNSMVGMVNPGYKYMITNTVGTAVTILQDHYNEVRE